MGSGEKPSMLEDARIFAEQLKPLQSEVAAFKLDYVCFEGEGHVSVIHPLISRMYRSLFAGEREVLSI
ncbi:hypothetical protein D3C84_1299200 [compost metagenome]